MRSSFLVYISSFVFTFYITQRTELPYIFVKIWKLKNIKTQEEEEDIFLNILQFLIIKLITNCMIYYHTSPILFHIVWLNTTQ